jgi:putative spermidine/putrescine transport system permease protein
MMKLSKKFKILLGMFTSLIFLFLFSPILIVFPLSFSDSSFLTWPPTGFSLRWYETFFGQSKWVTATLNSITVAVIVTVVSLLLGTMGAYGICRMKGMRKTALNILFIIPMVIPSIILALAYYFSFAEIGIKRSMLTVLIAHCIIAVPFVVSNVLAGLANFDWNTQRASFSLGADSIRTFWSVVVPAIQPSMIAGALFAFITSFDEVVIAQFISGTTFRTLPMEMFAGIKNEIQPTIAAAAAMLVILSVILQGSLQIISNRREAKFTGKIKKRATE